MLDLLEAGFLSALEFDAGLALNPDGTRLILNQWIPGAQSWLDIVNELDMILQQAAALRLFTRDDSAPASLKLSESVDERRLRQIFDLSTTSHSSRATQS